VRLMGESFTQVTGGPPTVVGFPAGCDLPLLIKYGGIPGVVFGPGNLAIAHGSNEYVELEEVANAAKIVAIAALRWCAASPGTEG